MKITFWSLFIGLALFSCNSNSSSNSSKSEVVSTLADDENTDAELKERLKKIELEEQKREKEEKSNVTTLSFDRLKHDFGDIQGDTDNSTTFTVTNTGDKPLLINDVKASCGCTTPKKPEGPILPGKSDVITVNFHPNPDQKNEIIKTVTVTANTDPIISTLTIRAFVK
ncbi:MAG: DUF1573 domain-containing protein [Bacteroidetes bacterium]|nr:DUF1573 domain-containing protein [Bacteroidota bacterium]